MITNQSTNKNITQLSIGTNSRNSTIAFVLSVKTFFDDQRQRIVAVVDFVFVDVDMFDKGRVQIVLRDE
jgi:hypothetical protein